MRIAIVGTRGIPNNYGGFEQFTEYLSKWLIEQGHSVTVYNPHNHKFQGKQWNGVAISHKFDPEYLIGTPGQFIYDLNCILDTRNSHFDIILQLGYTSSSIWSFLYPSRSVLITNMDGLEWKRSKYSKLVKRYLKIAERWAVRYSDWLVADSIGIQNYLKESHQKDSEYIPYGAVVFANPDARILNSLNLQPYAYDMLIARMEPENNIETILDGVFHSAFHRKMIVVGNTDTKYGKQLRRKYEHATQIQFVGSIYDINILNNLRYFSNLYFHGHSVGGTNPSLLEAMASGALICAHNNSFNKAILESDAFYFTTSEEISQYVSSLEKENYNLQMVSNNIIKINKFYNWGRICSQYEELFKKVLSQDA